MASLQEIQKKVDQAREKFIEEDSLYVKTNLWPAIKSMLGECPISPGRIVGKWDCLSISAWMIMDCME